MPPKSVEDTIEKMRQGTAILFSDLVHVCRHYFGEPRIAGSHHIFKMPWAGDPRINIQKDKNKAKAYQIRQVLAALDRLATEALAQKAAEKKQKKQKK